MQEQRSRQNKKKKNIAKDILLKILDSAMKISNEMSAMKYQSAYIKGGSEYVNYIKNYDKQRYFKKEISRLKKQNFIEERKRGDKLYLCLTEKGKKVALKYSILDCKDKFKNRYCLVVFDIPESERKIRDFFRNFLKEAGFIQLQQSVWVSQKNIVKELNRLVISAGAEKWINVITADYISNFKMKKLVSTKTHGRTKKSTV